MRHLLICVTLVVATLLSTATHARTPHPPASPWFLSEVQPLIAPIVDLAHTDDYGIDGDVVTWEEQGATYWVFVLVVLPVRDGVLTPLASVITVRQLQGERLRLWAVSKPTPWTPDLSLVNRHF